MLSHMIECHRHKNNQDKKIFKKCKPIMIRVSLILTSNTKHENQRQKLKICKT
jgi:hypothetical protein